MSTQSTRAKYLANNRRGYSLRRVLLLIAILQSHRFFVSTTELTSLINEQMLESFHGRTIHRDLRILAAIGMVQEIPTSIELGRGTNWQWIGFGRVDFLQQWDNEATSNGGINQ